MRTLLVMSVLLLLVVRAHATPEEVELWDFAHPYKQECSTGTTSELNACLYQAYVQVDTRLNVAYKRLQQSLANPASLRKAQIQWVRFRDLQCAFEVPPEWTGREVPYSRMSCLIDHTERRARDLERIVPCNGCVEFKPEHYK